MFGVMQGFKSMMLRPKKHLPFKETTEEKPQWTLEGRCSQDLFKLYL